MSRGKVAYRWLRSGARVLIGAFLPCSLAAALAVPATAVASGLELPGPGTTLSGAGRADAAAVHYNPGMLGLMRERNLLASGGLLVGSARYERVRRARYQYADSLDFALPIDEADIDPGRTGRAAPVRATTLAPQGDLFVALPLGNTPVVLGAGVYVPYGAILDLPDDGAQRWVVQDVAILNVAFAPSLAVRAGERFALGASMPVYAGFAELSRVQDFAELQDVGDALARPPIQQPNDFGPDAPPGVRELDVLARPIVLSRATAAAPTFGVGLAWQPTDSIALGASYTHRARMTYDGDIQIDMDDDFFTQDLASQGLQYAPLVEGRGTLSFVLPWAVRLGAVLKVSEQHELSVATSVVGWSTVDSFDVRAEAAGLAQPELGLPSTVSLLVPRRWNNTVDVEVGHTVGFGAIDVWYGLGVHSPAPPDRWMDLAAIDGWRAVVVGGLRRALTPSLTLLLDAEAQSLVGRSVRSSRQDIGNGEYNLTLFRASGHLDIRF